MFNIYLIVGKSGSGKSTIVDYAIRINQSLTSIESFTTRPPRWEGEKGHIFLNDFQFDQLENFVGYTEFAGYRYGATSQQVDNADLYVIDPAGVEYFKQQYKGHKTPKIVYIKSTWIERLYRMARRNGFKDAIKRILHDYKPFKGMDKKADIVIKNHNIWSATCELLNFIEECE